MACPSKAQPSPTAWSDALMGISNPPMHRPAPCQRARPLLTGRQQRQVCEHLSQRVPKGRRRVPMNKGHIWREGGGGEWEWPDSLGASQEEGGGGGRDPQGEVDAVPGAGVPPHVLVQPDGGAWRHVGQLQAHDPVHIRCPQQLRWHARRSAVSLGQPPWQQHPHNSHTGHPQHSRWHQQSAVHRPAANCKRTGGTRLLASLPAQSPLPPASAFPCDWFRTPEAAV